MSPSYNRRVRADDDADPPPKKKRQRDDADSDDEPRGGRKKKKKKTANRQMLLLAIGGGVALLMCCTCGGGVGGYYLFFSSPIVGKWEKDEIFDTKVVFEFRRDGTGKLTIPVHRPLKEPGTAIHHIQYTYKSGKPGTLEFTVTKVESKDVEGNLQAEVGIPQRLEVEFRDDKVRFRKPGEPFGGDFRRVR